MASSFQIHIPSCLQKVCKERMKRLCGDLEKSTLVCALEQRGDYPPGGLFYDTFKTMVEQSYVTVVHICQQMCTKLEMVMDICEMHADRMVFVCTEDTDDSVIPDAIRQFVIKDLSDEAYYDTFIRQITTTIRVKMPEPEVVETSEPDTFSFALQDYNDMKELEAESDTFQTLHDLSGSKHRGPLVLTSLLGYAPNPQLKWSTQDHCWKLATTTICFNKENATNTVKCIMAEVLPELFDDGKLAFIAVFVECNEEIVHTRALEMLEMLLLQAYNLSVTRKELEQVETILYDVLTRWVLNCKTSNVDHSEDLKFPLLRVYAMTLSLIVSESHRQKGHTELDRYIEMIRSRNESPLNKKAGKLASSNDELVKTVDTLLTSFRGQCCELADTSLKVLSAKEPKQAASILSKKGWPMQFYTVFSILTEFFQRPEYSTLSILAEYVTSFKQRKGFMGIGKGTRAPPVIGGLILKSLVIFLVRQLGEIHSGDVDDLLEMACKIINTVVKESLPAKSHLLDEMKSLLYHKNLTVRSTAMDIVATDDVNSDPNMDTMLYATLSLVQRLLSPSLINISKGKLLQRNELSRCKVYSGAMSGERILVHMHIPLESDLRQVDGDTVMDDSMNEAEILRDLAGHRRIVRLFAFSLQKPPIFYITEDYMHNNFQSVLRNKSKDRDWFAASDLMSILLDILEAVDFLHQKGVVHRDLTAASVFLVDGMKKAKLARLNLARRCQRDKVVVERDCSAIPTRWSAPESLRECVFSPVSDVWMVGHLIYEVMTHGCLPYSDLSKSDGELVELIIRGRKRLCHEKSIRKNIFEIIMQCTTREEEHRPTVTEVKCKLEEEEETYLGQGDAIALTSGPLRIADVKFPDLKTERVPSTEMKRGIPRLPEEDDEDGYVNYLFNEVKKGEQMRKAKSEGNLLDIYNDTDDDNNEEIYEDPLEIYENLHKATNAEHVKWIFQGDKILFRESITRRFTTKEWSSLRTEHLPGIPNELQIIQDKNENFLQYHVPQEGKGNFLETLSSRLDLGGDILQYIKCLHLAATKLNALHRKYWIHGDICAANVWTIKKDNAIDVWFLGLSHMTMIGRDGEDGLEGEKILSPPTDAIKKRRSAPEVLHGGIYSQASDVFSFGLMMWDILNRIGLSPKTRFGSRDGELCPLSTIPEEDLYEHITTSADNKVLPKPRDCPPDLYHLMVTCWCSERHERPSMLQLEQKLEQYIKYRTSCDMEETGEYLYSGGAGSEIDADEAPPLPPLPRLPPSLPSQYAPLPPLPRQHRNAHEDSTDYDMPESVYEANPSEPSTGSALSSNTYGFNVANPSESSFASSEPPSIPRKPRITAANPSEPSIDEESNSYEEPTDPRQFSIRPKGKICINESKPSFKKDPSCYDPPKLSVSISNPSEPSQAESMIEANPSESSVSGGSKSSVSDLSKRFNVANPSESSGSRSISSTDFASRKKTKVSGTFAASKGERGFQRRPPPPLPPSNQNPELERFLEDTTKSNIFSSKPKSPETSETPPPLPLRGPPKKILSKADKNPARNVRRPLPIPARDTGRHFPTLIKRPPLIPRLPPRRVKPTVSEDKEEDPCYEDLPTLAEATEAISLEFQDQDTYIDSSTIPSTNKAKGTLPENDDDDDENCYDETGYILQAVQTESASRDDQMDECDYDDFVCTPDETQRKLKQDDKDNDDQYTMKDLSTPSDSRDDLASGTSDSKSDHQSDKSMDFVKEKVGDLVSANKSPRDKASSRPVPPRKPPKLMPKPKLKPPSS